MNDMDWEPACEETRLRDAHRPECPAYVRNWGLVPPKCYCHMLRACEQRVIAESDEQSHIAYKTGYTAALREVDEKVLGLQTHYSTYDGDTTVNRAEVLWVTSCMRGEWP